MRQRFNELLHVRVPHGFSEVLSEVANHRCTTVSELVRQAVLREVRDAKREARTFSEEAR